MSEKSLISFPSFSPELPKDETSSSSRTYNDNYKSADSNSPVCCSNSTLNEPAVDSANKARSPLFDDAPVSNSKIPGAIYNLTTERIENLIARKGAVALVRQIAKDLAERDAQIAVIQRKSEEKERALKKIITECGLTNLEMETRLRAIEGEQRAFAEAIESQNSERGLEDLMSDAMNDAIKGAASLDKHSKENEATIRAIDKFRMLDERSGAASKGWKELIWGGTARKTSMTQSVSRDAISNITRISSLAGPAKASRKTVLQQGIFQPPEADVNNRALSQQAVIDNTLNEGKASLRLTALTSRLFASRKDFNLDSPRGRSLSTGASLNRSRLSSAASSITANSTKTVPVKSVAVKVSSESLDDYRKSSSSARLAQHVKLRTSKECWDKIRNSNLYAPASVSTVGGDKSGPVEMDTILSLDDQPPTLSQIYSRQCDQEFLTDRYGFIYDQRRKKRYKEVELFQSSKLENILKISGSSRNVESVKLLGSGLITEAEEEDKTYSSMLHEENNEKEPLKRWQDHLGIATFPTELLSLTPSRVASALEVVDSTEASGPSNITPEKRFLPSSSITATQPTVAMTSDNAIISKPFTGSPSVFAESHLDTEPVKILLKQLGDVHDSLQREKTINWNDFLRKVRAERRRDGEAAASLASNLSSISDSRPQRPLESMPETMLANGEIIGIAGLGNKGKVGRAKWNEFKSLILGGIPVAYRSKIWAECSGASTLRIPGYYESLINSSVANDDPVIIAQIKMDVNRTLTDNIYFRKGPGVSKLNEVLLAYSRRNSEVGYCQGMNLITAYLLLIMPTAEDVFWLLTSVIENILPQSYYDHSLMASRADQRVLRQLVSEILPKLSTHLNNLNIELEALTFQWFLSVFTDCLSAEALFRVWDVVFCTNDGSTFLFQVALALLKLNETQLLKCETSAKVYTYINHQMTDHAISIDGLIHASEGLRKVVKREAIESRRTRVIEAEQNFLRLRE